MSRMTAIVGVLGAVMAALLVLVLVPGTLAPLWGAALAVAGAIVLMIQGNRIAVLSGIIVLALSILGALASLESLAFRQTTLSFGDSRTGSAILVIACLALAAAPAALAWDRVRPRPLAIAGLVASALVAILVLARRDALVNQPDLVTLLTGILCLAAILPLVGLFNDQPPATRGSTATGAGGRPPQRP